MSDPSDRPDNLVPLADYLPVRDLNRRRTGTARILPLPDTGPCEPTALLVLRLDGTPLPALRLRPVEPPDIIA